MALINCPECGKEVSDQAYKCIYCGINLRRFSKKIRKEKKKFVAKETRSNNKAKIVYILQSKRFKIVLFTILLLLLIFSGVFFYLENCMIDVTNLTKNDAIDKLKERKIDYFVRYEHTETIHKDMVFKQSIKPYGIIDKDENVIIYVSAGKLYTVPELIGKTVEEIEESIKHLNYKLVYEYTKDTDEGIIVDSSVKPGNNISENSVLTITVSKGKYIQLPDVTNMEYEEAKELLKSLGAKVILKRDFNEIEKGLVYQYEPTKIYEENEKVYLYVSRGEGMLIPTVTTYSVEMAKKMLTLKGLDVSLDYVYRDIECNVTEDKSVIVSQSKEGRVEEASEVKLFVNKPAILITDINKEENYVGGIDTALSFKNVSDKQIAYITFELKYYDRMGNPAPCRITDSAVAYLKYTGPLNAGKSISNLWSKAVIYNYNVAAIKIISIEVEFSDGNTQKITGTGTYWYWNDYYGGDLND